MIKFKQYLNEKTFNISQDVDLLYKLSFKKYVDILNKKGFDAFRKEIRSNFANGHNEFASLSSKDLKSKKSKKAHEINPVSIQLGVYGGGSFYKPFDKLIQVSLNVNVIQLIMKHTDVDLNIVNIKYNQQPLNDIKETSIKGSIYHELSHWLSDTFYNQNILKRLKTAKETNSSKILTKFGSSLFTDYELDAQVHAIKQIKRNYKENWNKITWTDILTIKPALNGVFKELKKLKPSEVDVYRKLMLKRLNREKLLGKGLENSFYKAIKDAL